MRKNNGVFLPAIFLALAIYLLPMFPHGGSANELTRWATAASLVEKGSFEISWTQDLIGKNVDTATIDGRTYSNKAPGTAVLAAPFYAAARLFIGAPNASNIRVSWFVMRFFISTLPLFLLAYWLYKREADEFSLAVMLFGTPLFVYGLLFFSHVFVAVLIYLAFRLLYDDRFARYRSCLAAGLLSGLAVVCEFPAIFPVAVFGGGLLFSDKRERYNRIIFFVLGGLPFAGALLFYNYTIFGSPLSFSYAHESFPEWAEVAGNGVFGIGFPTLSNLYLLAVSPSRGLFFFSPVLILAVAAFFTSRERRTLRHRVKVAAVVVSFLLLCGHGAAHGGWAFGARYLVMLLPLLLDSFFDGEIYEYSNIWQGFLFAISFLLCVIPALTFSFAPPEFKFPHNNFWAAFLTDEQWFTPNLSNVFGASPGFLSTIPVLLLLLCAFAIVAGNARKRGKFTAGAICGALVVAVYLMLPNLDNADNRLRRAAIAERYFKPADRLENYRSQARADADVRQKLDGYEWTISDVRAFAPDDFPYLETRDSADSPSRLMRRAEQFQQQGNAAEAANTLRAGRDKFPFARCELTTNLAVVLYAANDKNAALTELEDVQRLINQSSSADCLRSQFLLGSLYAETGQNDKAQETLRSFLANSANSTDAEIKEFRRRLQSAAR